ncbi:MAG: SH3 domain-containing protein [Leptospiraceae bacterium]|nr:SH3 domain-containing protein [Leptospiraceae bacterium]
MKKGFVVLLCVFIFTGPLFSRESVYVTSPAAKIMTAPKISGKGTPVTKGTKLDVLAKEGLFYKVNFEGQTGYIPSMFVSQNAPAKKKIDLAGLKDKNADNPRRRASSYAETASARGLTASEKIRARGDANDYDYDSVKWMEEQSSKIEESETELFTQNIQ